MAIKPQRDHGGGLDAAIARYGGTRESWLDLSTGINPVPYPVSAFGADAWTALPDAAATKRLEGAARVFWDVPDGADIVIAPGASALIARLPALVAPNSPIYIPQPTYNEHAAAFEAAGHPILQSSVPRDAARVFVHPNNPTGTLWDAAEIPSHQLTIIDESFCDIAPEASHVGLASGERVIVLKSFGKFWGLAGLRLGFAICSPKNAARLRNLVGPWPVSGPALEIGAHALEDLAWAAATRASLKDESSRLDSLLTNAGAERVGGTALFRLYQVGSATEWQARLARRHIWSRIFPYSDHWLRLGLPAPDRWDQLEAALA